MLFILRDVVRGIAELHALGVVHGDIKPENILLSSSDLNTARTVLADFGLSKFREIHDICSSTLRRTSYPKSGGLGTPVYCAPEMFDNVDTDEEGASASRKTDMYAFAILCHHVLTRIEPFSDIKSKVILASKVQNGLRPDISSLPATLPSMIKDTIVQCWSSIRKDRPTAAEVYTIFDVAYNRLSSNENDFFLSHAWRDKYMISHIYRIMTAAGYKIWYDAIDMGNDIRKSMTDGIANSKAVMVVLNTVYQGRPNCMFELAEAKRTNKPGILILPFMIVIVGEYN